MMMMTVTIMVGPVRLTTPETGRDCRISDFKYMLFIDQFITSTYDLSSCTPVLHRDILYVE